ncbi:MAG: amine dehydrogenase [Gammaproteobacteria bacterium]|nr:amine dehydrogenase [Gammaproteobacteria bacterium]
MRTAKRWTWATMLLAGACTAHATDFQPEQITVAKLPAANPYRLYVSDVAISHMIDGRMHIVDGETLKFIGMIGTGFTGLSTVSPDRSEIYVATTYLAKLNRGTRTDQIDVYDSQTLTIKAEIEIPPKHAQSLPYKGTIAVTPDGRFIISQNATPASSVAISDRKAEKFVTEVPTPGCWAILPARSANRFTTICGDGTLLTVTLGADGNPTDQQRSEPLFNPDKDPLFTQTVNDGDDYSFLSFHGEIYTANLGGAVAKIGPRWSLLDDADRKENWRPGGYQPFALSKDNAQLYVAMHPNGVEGSHKNPAAEIWSFDLATKKRLERVAGNNAVALEVSRGANPLLFAIDPLTAGIVNYTTTPKLAVGKRVDGFGEAPILIETH